MTNVAPPPVFGTAPIVSPPPTFGPHVPVPSMGSPPVSYQQGAQPSYLQNRYVAYDPNAPPNPYGQSALPPTYPAPTQIEPSKIPPPANYSTSAPPTSPQNFSPSSISNDQPQAPIITTRLNNSPRIHVNTDIVFNPATDRVVSATSSSSAIL
jgi:hypothetical protein